MLEGARIIPIRTRTDACGDCTLVAECIARDPSHGERGCDDISTVPRVLRRGDHIFYSGDRFENVFMVRSGAIKTYSVSPAGDEQVVAFHMPGDIFGLDGMDTGEHATCAVVLDTSSVCVLPFERLCRLASQSPVVQKRFLGKVSRRIRDDESRLMMLGQKSADQRIAAFLFSESHRLESRGYCATELNLQMPRADIASYLGLAVETVSRVLTRLQEAAVIVVNRSRITISDLDALAEVAEERIEPSSRTRRAAH